MSLSSNLNMDRYNCLRHAEVQRDQAHNPANAPCTCHPEKVHGRDTKGTGCTAHDQAWVSILGPKPAILLCTCGHGMNARRQWVLGLKGGDEVFVMADGQPIALAIPMTIWQVIDQGLCHVDGTDLPLPAVITRQGRDLFYFDQDGLLRVSTKSDRIPFKSYIAPTVPEVVSEYKRKELAKSFLEKNWNNCSLERLQKVKEALQ